MSVRSKIGDLTCCSMRLPRAPWVPVCSCPSLSNEPLLLTYTRTMRRNPIRRLQLVRNSILRHQHSFYVLRWADSRGVVPYAQAPGVETSPVRLFMADDSPTWRGRVVDDPSSVFVLPKLCPIRLVRRRACRQNIIVIAKR